MFPATDQPRKLCRVQTTLLRLRPTSRCTTGVRVCTYRPWDISGVASVLPGSFGAGSVSSDSRRAKTRGDASCPFRLGRDEKRGVFMSKELVISATSHERRVAILEEGQLVEIYIEREKEFALVGSIYKGRVTRVLPGMQSAFVDIGLDGDAFLYVSDVFENLEDYDHGHAHEPAPAVAHSEVETITEHIELPGESLS